jgi:hypothetical protein
MRCHRKKSGDDYLREAATGFNKHKQQNRGNIKKATNVANDASTQRESKKECNHKVTSFLRGEGQISLAVKAGNDSLNGGAAAHWLSQRWKHINRRIAACDADFLVKNLWPTGKLT